MLALFTSIQQHFYFLHCQWLLILPFCNHKAETVEARVLNTHRHLKLDQLILNVAYHAQARTQAVALNRLNPDTPDRATDGMVPNTTSLIDVGFLLAARNVWIKGSSHT